MSSVLSAPVAVPAASTDEFASQAGNPDFVLSLARGLRVIESFEGHHDGRSIVEISQSTGLSRASIRRILLTLELLGYVERSRQVYRLRTQVLRLGFSYLSSSSVVEAARPVLEQISEELHESSSMSMLLAALPDEELAVYLRDLKPKAHTPKTLTRIPQIRKAILQARKDCYAIVDEELEAGLRSIAVPIFTRGNRVVAAINVGTHISRVDRGSLVQRCLPALQKGARTLRSILI